MMPFLTITSTSDAVSGRSFFASARFGVSRACRSFLIWLRRRDRFDRLRMRRSTFCRTRLMAEALWAKEILPGRFEARPQNCYHSTTMKSPPRRNPRYSTGNPELDKRIEQTVGISCPEAVQPYAQEIATTTQKLAIDGASRVDLKIASAALKEMRHAFRVFTPFRHVRKVTVFGSARTAVDHSDHDRAVEFGRRMAEAGWMVVTGAGSGIMGAAHIGAGRDQSVGVNIKLPFEQEANEIIRGDGKLMTFRYFFTRNLFLLKESHAVTLFPGGFGTLDESFEVLTLLQTGKQTPLPVVMGENLENGYFQGLSRFIQERLLASHLISEQDLALYRGVDTAKEASEEGLRFYRVYHSSRYVGPKLLIRLEPEPDDSALSDLNRRFHDILRSGVIERAQPLPEEQGTPLSRLARIELDFNRRDFGRLRQLIDAINAFGPR